MNRNRLFFIVKTFPFCLPTENSYCLRTQLEPDGDHFLLFDLFLLHLFEDADCVYFKGGRYRDRKLYVAPLQMYLDVIKA